ncbi:hypothetical protein MEX01_36620 [Methylorubrum extorquens]|nr:hypothetical protein MEX01_36620 [Methylorubrum extorquens]
MAVKVSPAAKCLRMPGGGRGEKSWEECIEPRGSADAPELERRLRLVQPKPLTTGSARSMMQIKPREVASTTRYGFTVETAGAAPACWSITVANSSGLKVMNRRKAS